MAQITKPEEYVKQMIDSGREVIGTHEGIEITIALMELDESLGFLEVYSPSLDDVCQVDMDDMADCQTTDCIEEIIWRTVLAQYKTEQGI